MTLQSPRGRVKRNQYMPSSRRANTKGGNNLQMGVSSWVVIVSSSTDMNHHPRTSATLLLNCFTSENSNLLDFTSLISYRRTHLMNLQSKTRILSDNLQLSRRRLPLAVQSIQVKTFDPYKSYVASFLPHLLHIHAGYKLEEPCQVASFL